MRYLLLIFTVFTITNSYCQAPKKANASEIYEAIQKANTLASVLYIAAHPDDENTTLISYLANEKHARTAYLSLTRGDGGQNLIGPEIRELLGIIRTQELLAARRTDGGEQRFTRANDFGYSKHPDETLEIWNKDEVLSDVVRTIRQFKPDVIINRFDHRSPGTTHGHHTSSAMLGFEAFDLAGASSAYKNQNSQPWQAKRLFFNTSWWFYGGREEFAKADKSNLLEFETGVYFPSKGLSNSEISALSRSQHKSQGFGRTGSRGSDITYLELLKGDMPKDKSDLFEGIDTSWSRIKGGEAVGDILNSVLADYDFSNPSASIPNLMNAYTTLQGLDAPYWKPIKSQELRAIIASCAGLYLEAVASSATATRGDTFEVDIEAINRSPIDMTINTITFPESGQVVSDVIKLPNNDDIKRKLEYTVKTDAMNTSAYWLEDKGTLGMYSVANPKNIGKPETVSPHKAIFEMTVSGQDIKFIRPIVYRYGDPVKGEVYEPFDIVPKASVSLADDVTIFSDSNAKPMRVTVTAYSKNLKGTLKLNAPQGWTITPQSVSVDIPQKGESRDFSFMVTPPSTQSEGYISPVLTSSGKSFSKELQIIAYDHIPTQRVLLPAEAKVVRLDIKKKGENIGYIDGAGDVVPESLEQIGYKVTTIAPEDISVENLKQFDAVVVGIRAYNTVDELKFKQDALLKYVENGGNLVIQYNTSHRLKVSENLAPYDLKLSRDRVTDEFAEVKFLAPNHPVLNTPNDITQKDFEGWVQERGLYFPNEWATNFTPILSMNDKGESPKQGSLLVAPYGKGHYIYTGLSFFREFPAGVSGAYRLFANLLSIGK